MLNLAHRVKEKPHLDRTIKISCFLCDRSFSMMTFLQQQDLQLTALSDYRRRTLFQLFDHQTSLLLDQREKDLHLATPHAAFQFANIACLRKKYGVDLGFLPPSIRRPSRHKRLG